MYLWTIEIEETILAEEVLRLTNEVENDEMAADEVVGHVAEDVHADVVEDDVAEEVVHHVADITAGEEGAQDVDADDVAAADVADWDVVDGVSDDVAGDVYNNGDDYADFYDLAEDEEELIRADAGGSKDKSYEAIDGLVDVHIEIVGLEAEEEFCGSISAERATPEALHREEEDGRVEEVEGVEEEEEVNLDDEDRPLRGEDDEEKLKQGDGFGVIRQGLQEFYEIGERLTSKLQDKEGEKKKNKPNLKGKGKVHEESDFLKKKDD